jgi:hypothetical protein
VLITRAALPHTIDANQRDAALREDRFGYTSSSRRNAPALVSGTDAPEALRWRRGSADRPLRRKMAPSKNGAGQDWIRHRVRAGSRLADAVCGQALVGDRHRARIDTTGCGRLPPNRRSRVMWACMSQSSAHNYVVGSLVECLLPREFGGRYDWLVVAVSASWRALAQRPLPRHCSHWRREAQRQQGVELRP